MRDPESAEEEKQVAAGMRERSCGVELDTYRWHKEVEEEEAKEGQCTSRVVQRIRAPVGVVWSVVRRFDRPQAYKPFVRSCRMLRMGGQGPFLRGESQRVGQLEGLLGDDRRFSSQESQCLGRLEGGQELLSQERGKSEGRVRGLLRQCFSHDSHRYLSKLKKKTQNKKKKTLGTGAIREVRFVSGLPATRSTERLDLLDDRRFLLRFSVLDGDHRLRNYRSTISLHPILLPPFAAAKGPSTSTLVIQSYVVDIPNGNSVDDTRTVVNTAIRTNLRTLALVSERLAQTGS